MRSFSGVSLDTGSDDAISATVEPTENGWFEERTSVGNFRDILFMVVSPVGAFPDILCTRTLSKLFGVEKPLKHAHAERITTTWEESYIRDPSQWIPCVG